MVVERTDPGSSSALCAPAERFLQMVMVCPDAFLEVSDAGVVTEWNPRAEQLLGWRRGEVVGLPIVETLVPPELGDSPFRHGRREGRLRFELAHRAGHRVAAEGLLFVTGDGSDRGIGTFLYGLDEVVDPIEVLSDADRHDPLTELPDRGLFGCRLSRVVARTQGVPGSVAVVLLDLDRFKAINNTMGHDAGDRILVSVADRLRRVAGDAELVARFGGDEFLAMFQTASGTAQQKAADFIERMRAAMAEPFDVEGSEVFLDASFGVALNTFGVDAAGSLLSNAEAAMYQAKRRGGSSVETFGEAMRLELLDRMATEHSLHRALERSELMLHYQPVVEIDGITTVGVEALIRWQHPDQGLVSPYRFIPVAEESGLIIPIGAWVLEEACHQLRDWHHQGPTGPQGSVEVNLSARQIDNPQIVRTVEEILSRTGLPPEHLTLEITESALMKDAGSALQVLRALKEIGVLLAIDDFGTGYSSLSYLQRFPLDVLKVDRSFVEELGVSSEGEEIVSAVIKLAHALGLKVVAEGVETTRQLEVLRSLECDYAQGFLFSRPVPAADLIAAFGLQMIA